MASSSTTAFCQDTIAAIASLDGPFTCASLRKQIQSNYKALEGLSSTQARMATYYRIKQLIKAGWLEVQPNTKGPKQQYMKATRFETPSSAPEVQQKDEQDDKSQAQIKKELEAQLSMYKTEMLSLQGEAEEYERLYSVYPGQKSNLMITFEQAVDAKSKLIGRIRAIENQIRYCKA